MWQVWSAETQEGWLSSQGWQLKIWRDISVAGMFPWEVWDLNPKLGSPAYSIRAKKEHRWHPAVKSSWVSVSQGETAGDSETLLNNQCTKFGLQPFTLGSSRGRAEWTRDTWGESEAGASGERTEGTDARISGSHYSQAERSYLNGISLRGSKGPLQQVLCPTLWSLSLAADYNLITLTTHQFNSGLV